MADSEDNLPDPDHEGEAADEQRYKQERAAVAEASAREALAASAEAKKSDFSDLMADPNAAPGPMVPQAPIYDLINKLPDQAPAPAALPAPPDYPPDVASAVPSQSLPGEDRMRVAAKSLLAPAAPEKKKEKTVGQKIGAGLQAAGQQLGAGNSNLPQAEMPQLQFQQIHLDAIKQLHEWLNSGGFRNG